MNQSIGCGPMPFALVSDKAAAENATHLPAGSKPAGTESEASFSDVLESEIEDEVKPEKDRSQVEAWTLYGIASVTVQIPPANIGLSNPSVEALEVDVQGSAAVLDQGEHPAEHPSPKGEIESVPVEGTEDALKMRLETLKLAEQKVPSPPEADLKGREQIAENPPKPAKIAYGMVAAQGELMVSESPKQEETALGQNLSLSSDLFADTNSDEPVASKPVASAKELPKIEIDFADIAPVESLKAEWSSFEGISEPSEAQPIDAIDAIEIAEAIRTQVQVLKGSSQEKLDVVLRPDSQTELRLHVEKVNGQILVQARCDRGDFARLEASWTSVQQSLANQGIRVESLEHGNFSQSSNEFQNPSRNFDQRSAAEQQRSEHNFIEQKSRATKNPQAAANRGTVQGWQSWA